MERLKGMPGFAMYDADYLTLLIAAASAQIEAYLNRKLALQEVTERKNGSEASPYLHLSRYPIVGEVTAEVCGEPLDDVDVLNPELGRLYRKGGWPSGIGNVRVTYTGGYILPGNDDSNLPDNIELACILEVQQLMRTPGVTSERVGEISVTYATEKMSSASRSLLDGYRRFA
ncbi:phage gp6-like head-tail connector protein [Paenibacillus sp. UNC496MF]|uniref:phage gp6-like head-tail connector protein n=1 Tax=Paenibacillus sp. UNC496MF TaxID=1502753 RepID=UPI001C434B79|nr:phage gp6-like head-tail connector protein [Paenibacillus sp. UNC496MF]